MYRAIDPRGSGPVSGPLGAGIVPGHAPASARRSRLPRAQKDIPVTNVRVGELARLSEYGACSRGHVERAFPEPPTR